METPWDFLHIAIFSLYQNFHFLWQHSLTRMFLSLYKNTYSKSIQRYLFESAKTIYFSLRLCFVYKNVQWFIIEHMHLNIIIVLQINKIERRSLMALRDGEISLSYFHKIPAVYSLIPSGTKLPIISPR